MPISSADLRLYKSFSASADTNGASTLTSADATGGKGGAINTGAQITGSLHEIFRAVSGTDIVNDPFVDYYKVYVRNVNVSLDLLSVAAWVSQESSYTEDDIAVAIGFPESGGFVTYNTEDEYGRVDYDEDINGSTVADSCYPRITGTGLDIEDVDTYSIDNNSGAGGPWDGVTSSTISFDMGAAISNGGATDLYLRVVGELAGAITIGYIFLEDGTTPAGVTATVNRDGSGGDVLFDRILSISCHDLATAASATNGDREGDVFHIPSASNTDGTFTVDDSSTICGRIRCLSSGVGQVFVPAFFKASWINTKATAMRLPAIGDQAPAQNEFGLEKTDWCALWIRRTVDQSASAESGIHNQVQIYGSSS